MHDRCIDSVLKRYNRVRSPLQHLIPSKQIRALDRLANKIIDRKSLIEILLTVKRNDSATWYAFKPLRKQFTRNQLLSFFKIYRAGLLSETNIELIWQSRNIATFLKNTLRDFEKANVLNEYTLFHIMKLVKKPEGCKLIEATHYLFQSNLLTHDNIKLLFKSKITRESKPYIAIKKGLEHLRNAGILDQILYDVFLKHPPYSDYTNALDILLCYNILSYDIVLELYEHHLSYNFCEQSRNLDSNWKIDSLNPHSRTPQNVALGLSCIASAPFTLGLTKENRALWYSVIKSGLNDEILEAMEIFHALNILKQPLLEKVIKMHNLYLPSDTNLYYYAAPCYTKKFQHAQNFKYTVNCLLALYEKDNLNLDRAYELLENCEHPDKIATIIREYPSLSKKTNKRETCFITLTLSQKARFHPKDAPRTKSRGFILDVKTDDIELSKDILMSFCNMRLEQNKKIRSNKEKNVFAFFKKDYVIEDFYIAAYQDFMRNFPENETLIFILKKFKNIDLFIAFMYIRREVNTILRYVSILLENKKFTITKDFRRIMQYYHLLQHTFNNYSEISIHDLLQYQKNIDKAIMYFKNRQKSREIVKSFYNYLYI